MPPGAKPKPELVSKGPGKFETSSVEHYLNAPVTPDLAVPSAPLEQRFPGSSTGTQVVLYEGASDQLRLQWTLAADDLLRVVPSFPAAGGSPVPTLRLYRIHEGGGREVLVERPLRAARVGGRGEAAFRVGLDYGRFSVDLGLLNDDGGWLVLTRSNQLQRAGSLGLRFPIAPSLLSRRGRRAPASEGDVDRAYEGVLADRTSSRALEGAVAGKRAVGESGGAELGPDSNMSAERPPGAYPGVGTATDAASQIPLLVYGCPAPAGLEVFIEAELHVHGCATPNTEIVLFGRRYRVGPGGRFRFVIRVDDPALLERAFALHPPPDASFTRDD